MAFEEENTMVPQRALEELSGSNYEIKDGEPDITGWNVLNQSGEKLGEVEDLLFDPEARKVRYLIVELQANGEDIFDDKYIAVPIGVAELDSEEDEVLLPISEATQLTGLPAYVIGSLTPEDEVQIRQVFEGGSSAPYEHPQFYAHEHFNEDKFYNRGNLPANDTIIPVEEMDQADGENRTERVSRIMNRINHSDDQSPAATPSVLAYGSANDDFRQEAAFAPELEGAEQEKDWLGEQESGNGNSKLAEFFINELKDLLWAERELAENLPDLAEAATSTELKTAFEMHKTETETHVTRLEQVFSILGLEPESRKCDAMAGILDEGDEIIDATEEGTAQRDVGLIFAGQKAEHYEIASYGGMIALAKTLGYYEIAELFVLTLDEEKTADAKLTEIAESQANHDAAGEPSED